MTCTDPRATELDLAAIAACRESRWPTAAELYGGVIAEREYEEKRAKGR